jgi:hypothetical protein
MGLTLMSYTRWKIPRIDYIRRHDASCTTIASTELTSFFT